MARRTAFDKQGDRNARRFREHVARNPITRVFVYGSLIRLADERATLDGYRLAFWTGLATIEPEEGATVAGAILHADPERLAELDRYEGLNQVRADRGLYRRETVMVNGEPAQVYVMNERLLGRGDDPGSWYVAGIAAGYDKFDHELAPLFDAARAAGADTSLWQEMAALAEPS